MSQTLQQLMHGLPPRLALELSGDPSVVVIAPVAENAAAVEPGGIFVARKGLANDGHDFIPQAIANGAAAIVGERDDIAIDVPYVRVRSAQSALGWFAAAWHGHPSQHLRVAGVTGTDGKTTTSHLIHSILQLHTGGRAGLISTISAEFGGEQLATGLHVTTPSAPDVQGLLAQMLRQGMTHVVLEMTSHGLAQGRLEGVAIDVAVMTNVTHEHLDYHGTWSNYRDAKLRMFQMLGDAVAKPGQPKVAVVNADDASAEVFGAVRADKVIRYGLGEAAGLRAVAADYRADGTAFEVDGRPYRLQLVGPFNVHNALAAMGAARAFGVGEATIAAGLGAVEQISGRMQRIDAGQNFMALVDFAHTPNALDKALTAGREMLRPGKRLIAVFGSAGLRDVAKRRMMAETSARLADITILTAEDPRTESLDAILESMMRAACDAGGVESETVFRIPDRGEAIYAACQMAAPGDLVMVCGKGHEQSMCFGTVEYPWDDRDALSAALRGAPLRALPTATPGGRS
jgi:UDP-N-acetylmuramoyl-L-alanyl-D-glutamate--2,6-diaminopimelate ligase